MSEETIQAGDTGPDKWDWVERTVWTDRMLEALENGVKGDIWYSLIDKVHRLGTLANAWQYVRRAGGAAGSDQQSLEQFEKRLDENLEKLSEELRTQKYRPRPIRRTYIDKPGSKEKRPLGIPSVRDRVVQTALKMVIEPIFEHIFMSNSYGFRPRKGCKDALRRVEGLLSKGYTWVVDTDLKSYFDSIPHNRLMEVVQEYIADSRVLGLIEGFLKQEILEDLQLWTPERGAPQGAVISPLLSNIYLHTVDKAMKTAGYEMVRYADDFIILCKSRQEAESALAFVSELTRKLELILHAGEDQPGRFLPSR